MEAAPQSVGAAATGFAAVLVLLLVAGAGPAAAHAETGETRLAGARAAGAILSRSPSEAGSQPRSPATVLDTGQARTRGATHEELTEARISHPLASATANKSRVDVDHGRARASATLSDVEIALPGAFPVTHVQIRELTVAAEANCGEVSGWTRVRGVTAGPFPLLDGGIRTPLDIGVTGPGSTRFLVNRQSQAPGADHGGVVTGLQVSTPGGTDIALGRVRATVDSCHADGPPPNASFQVACVELSCRFDARRTHDPGGNVTSYRWELGDGTNDRGQVVEHAFPRNGTYQVNLTVTDNETLEDRRVRNVTVASASPACDAVVSDDESIQEAVDSAEPGATICLQTGTYDQTVTLRKRLHLRPVNRLAEPRLVGSNVSRTAVTVRNATGVTVEGLTIRGYQRYAVRATAPNLTLRDNTVVATGGTGFDLEDAPGALVEGNLLRRNDAGMSFYRSDGATIRGNDVTSVSDPAPGAGIGIAWTDNATVTDNHVDGHQPDLFVTDSTAARFAHNRLGDGMFLQGNALEHLVHDVENNTANGAPLVYVTGTDRPDFPPDPGQIVAVDVTNVTVEGYRFENVTQAVQVAFADAVRIAGNTVRGSDSDAIHVHAATNVTVEDNTLRDSSRGIRVLDAPGAEVAGNVVTGSHADGLRVVGSPDARVHDNEARSSRNGVSVSDSPGARVRGNAVRSNSRAGLFVEGGASTVLANNTAARNGDGLLLEGPDGVTARHNTLSDNTDAGVRVTDHLAFGSAPNTTLRANDVADNEVGIVVAGATPGTEIHGNNIHGQKVGLDAGDASHAVNATGNWWGCPHGPDSSSCDAVRGQARYDPWLSTRNAEAGAG